jgi:mevalonate kinase
MILLDPTVEGDIAALAAAMQENQAIIAELGGSGPQIDALIETCIALGARAAKLAGAGMGGTVIVLTHDPVGMKRGLQEQGFTQITFPLIAPGIKAEPEIVNAAIAG